MGNVIKLSLKGLNVNSRRCNLRMKNNTFAQTLKGFNVPLKKCTTPSGLNKSPPDTTGFARGYLY